MQLTWRERLQTNPEWRDIRQWPAMDIDTLPAKFRAGYLLNRKIVARVLSGRQINAIAKELRIDRSNVSRLMKRCLAGTADTPPTLTQGLIPYARQGVHQRRAPLATLTQPHGAQNAFRYLLDAVPNMRIRLDQMIILRLKDEPHAQVCSLYAFHGEFKRLLAEANWPQDQYPYTTASCAAESVRRYYHERINILRLLHMKSPTRVIAPQTPIYRALREVQIDTQVMDLNTSIHLILNEELIPLRIRRVCLLLCVDVATDCFLGYHLALSREPSQDDLLQLIDNVIRPWSPEPLSTPGLVYTPGSGFPSMWDGDFSRMTFGMVKLDNALTHLASTVRFQLCDRLGATLNLGLPGTPKSRNWVEMAFQHVNRLTHRSPSTTGSHPNDPIKESRKNQKSPPKFTFRMLNEALSVSLADHNVTPRAELGNSTPMALLYHHANNHYLRWMPEHHSQTWSPFESETHRRVIFLNNEQRLPFIRLNYVRYQGACLKHPHLLNARLRIRYDRRDIRVVYAYTELGEYLGELYAPHSWQRFAHSLYTRKKIFKAMKTWRHGSRDPLADLFHQLIEQKNTPSTALELLRIYREANRYVPGIESNKEPDVRRNSSASDSVGIDESTATLDATGGGCKRTGDSKKSTSTKTSHAAPESDSAIQSWNIDWVKNKK